MGCETHDTADPEQDRVKIRMPDAVMLLQCSCDRIDIRPGVGDFAGRFEHIRCDGKNIHCRPEQIIVRKVALAEFHLCDKARIDAAQNGVPVSRDHTAFGERLFDVLANLILSGNTVIGVVKAKKPVAAFLIGKTVQRACKAVQTG